MSEPAPQLFTVTVRGPGKSRWGVVVRAPDESSAGRNVESRGHTVLAVRPGMIERSFRRLPRAACIRCGYSLADLPPGAASEVMCPECGVINTPEAVPLKVQLRTRRSVVRLWFWGIVIAGVVLLWLSPLLMRFL